MKLQDPALRSKKIFFYSSHHPHKRANAAVLMACYAVIYLGRTPEEAYRPFESTAPKFTPFHDASQFACTFNLTVMDCCKVRSRIAAPRVRSHTPLRTFALALVSRRSSHPFLPSLSLALAGRVQGEAVQAVRLRHV